MDNQPSMKIPSIFMLVFGISMIVSMPFAYDIWPAGFRWVHPGINTPYEHMIAAIYVALGICMIKASRDPLRHAILMDFTILSSIFHASVMLWDAIFIKEEHTHLIGDVPMMYILAAVAYYFHPVRWARTHRDQPQEAL